MEKAFVFTSYSQFRNILPQLENMIHSSKKARKRAFLYSFMEAVNNAFEM